MSTKPKHAMASTTSELTEAIVKDTFEIEIEGPDLLGFVVRIKATGNIAWILAIGSLGTAGAVFIGSGGSAALIAGTTAVAAVGVLGYRVAVAATEVMITAITHSHEWGLSLILGADNSFLSPLNSLRRHYDIISQTEGKLLLQRKA